MPPDSKRKAATIDLTNDSDVENYQNRKKSKHSTYVTPPSSSQPLHHSQIRTNSSSQKYNNLASSQGPSQNERDTWSSTQQAAIDADIGRSITLTQDEDDEDVYENKQLYGIFNTKIVGVRFYNGEATVNEYVMVRREPSNPYDTNAIRCDNVRRQQIGHIGRANAAKLAPFIDSGELIVEGVITGGKGEYDCPIGLKLFGTSDQTAKWDLRKRMLEAKLPCKELDHAEAARKRQEKEFEKQRKAREKELARLRRQTGSAVIDNVGPGRYSNFAEAHKGSLATPDIASLLDNTATFNPRDIRSAVSKFVQTEDDLAKMALADQPKELSTQLLPYQRQGLQWLLEHESPSIPKKDGETVQFWKRQRNGYLNIVTNFLVRNEPELASGGILADDMGLGKTIQIISLILADPKKSGNPTLIVAPLSVMSNWKNQAETHTKTKYAPNCLIYHGQQQRGLSPEQFKGYDIVITTYQTMTLELFAGNKDTPCQVPTAKGLFSVNWRRVILDEGHTIRNPKAKMSRAAHMLMADSRWVLSGTPIVNNLKDLYSHVKFLHMSGGLAEFEIFNANIIRTVKSGDPNGQALLRALMQTLCLRRMKDMKFIDLKLPDLIYHVNKVKWLPQELEKYDAFKAEAKGLVQAAKARKGENTMTHLLEVLLRLRQTCNHWKMCGEERMSCLLTLIEEGKIVDVVNPANKRALQDLLQLKLDSQDDCPICMESLTTNSRITACGHVFCTECIERTINVQQKCPMCRAQLPSIDSLVPPAASFGESLNAQDLDIDVNESSSKIEAIVKLLRATDKDDPDTKTVLFSQWTSFLDILEPQLKKSGILFTRLDGRMSPQKRDAAIDSLTKDGNCRVLLASLSACSTGINLTAANQVIMCDQWWAPAVHDQAVDRVYRLGQKKECRVVQFVMEGSVEEEVLEVQKNKRELVSAAFGDSESRHKRSGEAGRAARLQDIERLLQ